MTTKARYGKKRYKTYEFPKLEVIEQWSETLYSSWSSGSVQFNEWEEKFIKDIYEKLAREIELSEETVWKLEQLYANKTD